METASFISVVNNYDIYRTCVLQNKHIMDNPYISCIDLDNTADNKFVSVAYNQLVDSYDLNNDTWFIFCHNDWEIKEDIITKLSTLDKNKIYGPIGAVLYETNDNHFFNEICGECYEKKRDGTNERLVKCKTIETGVNVDTLGCQCLIIHSSIVRKYNLRFDENLEFDLYVEDFCLNAKVNYNIETNILHLNCCHWSQLEDIKNRPSYARMIKYLNTKYSNYKFSGTCSLIGNVDGLNYKNINHTYVYADRSTTYQSDVDVQNDNDPRSFVAKYYVTDGATVLDVGCACGDLGVALKKHRRATIVGMEYDKGSIAIARQTNAFEDVHQVDLNNFVAEDFKQYYGKFDYIVFGDVLEHINDPQNAMETFKIFLKKDGAFLASFPNISHGSIKMNLLIDDWTYTEVGILDKTHIRFFTHKSIAPFLAEIGLKITEMKYTVLGREGTQPNRPWKELPATTLRFIYKNPHSFIVQYVLKIIPEEKTFHYGKLLFINREKLEITNYNRTELLEHHMSRRSPFRFVTKIRGKFSKNKK